MAKRTRSKHKCRWCDFTTNKWRELSEHILLEHEDEYVAVEKWIHDTMDEKLLTATRLAKESMKPDGNE